MKERKPELRRRILKLHEIGLKSNQISIILGIASRTVRYYLASAASSPLQLRSKANSQDLIWIERLNSSGARIEEISDILRLSGRVIFNILKDHGLEMSDKR